MREHRAVLDESVRVHNALAQHGAQAMATGQLLWVSFETGHAVFVNAGHVWPLLLRNGQVEEITPIVDLPFGIAPATRTTVQTLDLRPGDRLVLITDGMLEPDGDNQHLCRLIKETGGQHPRDAIARLHAIRAAGHRPRPPR